uniref:carbonic anhydrase 4b n=1 Tax=Monopterus albus TaxID=43700 RepID=UPI0009B2FDF6|nr:carbonic anhydrase 4-like [Monopterus albus]
MKIVSGAEWCYQSQFRCDHTCTVPDSWGKLHHQCSGGAQSPVNIVTRSVQRDEHLIPFKLTGYEKKLHGHLINNGHTIQMDLPSSLKIERGNLTVPYKALQFHLHWGKNGGPGSEHTIDGEQFPMEMHVVHIKEEYDCLSQAAKDGTGVAVLGFFFQEHPSANKKFDPLIDALKNITYPTNRTTLRGVSLDMFLPSRDNLTKYFRYDGSLTTPNCSEGVVWSLFESTIPLSKEQLASFSQLRFSDGNHMVNTYRPVQPLNGRQVYYSRGHAVLISTVLLFMSTLLSSALSLHTQPL